MGDLQKSLLKKKLHVFDLDDTLVVTRPTYWGAQEKALAEIFIPDSQELGTAIQKIKILTKQFSSSFPELYSKALFLEMGKPEAESAKLAEQFLSAYHKHYWNDIEPIADAITLLQYLLKQGKNVALISNGNRENQLKKLEATELAGYFQEEAIFVSGDYPADFKKPAPAMVDLCLRHFQIEASEAVYYGNLMTDVIAGNLAGCSTVYLNADNSQLDLNIAAPSLTIQHWSELIPE